MASKRSAGLSDTSEAVRFAWLLKLDQLLRAVSCSAIGNAPIETKR